MKISLGKYQLELSRKNKGAAIEAVKPEVPGQTVKPKN